jgi:cytoskeletal protein CcmA (bactofilin family)
MWGTKKNQHAARHSVETKSLLTDEHTSNTIRLPDSTPCRSAAWLGPSLHVKGDITGCDDLLIDGSVEGTIQLDERRLTVGSAAKLKADINALDVVVSGQVKGNVRATRRIEIKKDASVIGDLTTAEIMIERGANFKGSIEIDRSETKKPDQEVSLLTASSSTAALNKNTSSLDPWKN